MEIRVRRLQDSPGLFALFNEDGYQRDAAWRGPFQRADEIDPYLASLARRRIETVAVDSEAGGAVAAYAGLFQLEDRLSHSGWLSLGVAKTHRRKGLGRKLLATLLRTASLAGMRRVQLNVIVDNFAAIRLYESLGFQVEGRYREFIQREGEFVDALAMAVLLAPSQSPPEHDKRGLS